MKYLVFLFIMLTTIIKIGIAQSTEQQIDELLTVMAAGKNVEGVIVTIRDVRFETASSTLATSTIGLLDKVVELLDRVDNINLVIVGHSDSIGQDDMNLQLSLERANSVKHYLVQKGITTNRIKAYGKGEQEPIVANNSDENRAINRRVEFEIIKTEKEEIIQIQDIIHLKDGSIKGVVIIDKDDTSITYRDIETGQAIKILIDNIDYILYANGALERFKEINLHQDSIQEERMLYEKDTIDLFSGLKKLKFFLEASPNFEKGTVAKGFGLGLGNNVNTQIQLKQTRVPPIHFAYEKAIQKWQNVGVGFSLGAMVWQVEDEINSLIAYTTFSPRVSYHFNLGKHDFFKNIDLYTGIALNNRIGFAHISEADRTFIQYKFDLSLYIGIRYYFKPNMGVFFERGGDGVACTKLGLQFKLLK